jgi:putative tricarboxylic transport membrane protein
MAPAGTGASLRRRVHTDVPIGAVIVAFCALVFAATFGFETVPDAFAMGMGPEAFPRLVLVVMALLAVFLGWQAHARPAEARERVPPMVLYTGLALVAFVLLTDLVGMLGAGFLLVVGLGRLWGERRLVPLTASAALLCAAIWLVFVRIFGITLPAGLVGALWS